MNPYWGKDFWSFILLFFQRMFDFLTGTLRFQDLASDEIQVLVLGLIALASACCGTFLVLKKMSMLANSLSHTILLGLVVAYLLFAKAIGEFTLDLKLMLIAALLTGILTTLLTQFFTHVIKLQEDASIGLVFTSLFALGVILVTVYTRSTHIGTEAIMGNADALHPHDVKLALVVALFSLLFVLLFQRPLTLVSFDPGLASTLGISPHLYTYILMALTSFTAIGAFRAVGVLLFLALLVGPVLTARLLTHHLKTLLFLSAGLGMLASLIGVALARHLLSRYGMPLSTAGLVVTLIGLFFLIALAIHLIKNRTRQQATPQA